MGVAAPRLRRKVDARALPGSMPGMSARWLCLAAALALLAQGCASHKVAARRDPLHPPARESRAGASARSAGPVPGSPSPSVIRAVADASSLAGRRTIVLRGVDYGYGCVALVRAAFDSAGFRLPEEVRDAAGLYAFARRQGALSATQRPSVGDLVFLADRPGGSPQHVGLVTATEPDGTAIVLHRVARGVLRLRVNLASPGRAVDPATGRHVNDTLLVNARPSSAGALVVGVSDLLRRE